MLKKIIGILVAGVLTVGLVACSNQSETTQAERLETNLLKTSAQLQKGQRAILERLNTVHIYEVTNERSENYIKTINKHGSPVWLSDVEIDLLDLEEGDKVKILLNEFGEVITLEEVVHE